MIGAAESETPTERIYKDRAIAIATFFGGPLVGGYLMSENFKVFGERSKSQKALIYSILATVLIFVAAFSIPYSVDLPAPVIPLTYTIVAQQLVKWLQGKPIQQHLEAGGETHNGWRVFGISFIGFLIIVTAIFAYISISDSILNADVTSKVYGAQKHEIVYDSDNITEAEIDQIAEAFIATNFFDNEVTKYAFAHKTEGGFELSISVINGVAQDPDAIEFFNTFRTDMQALFPNHKIALLLVIDDFSNVVKRIE